tara:strand:+ start:75 stop:263 length:189 start_codon:yes stop_codon:yes gene_type:complete
MIKLQHVSVKDHVMWVKEESVTAVTKVPQHPAEEGIVYWNIHGAGWSVMVADLPTQLKWMVR